MENKTYKIHKQRIILPDYKQLHKTLKNYNNVIHYLLPKIALELEKLSSLKSKEKNNFIERLFHKTETNPNPKYSDFNHLFPNFPSYFRRTAIQDSIGIIQSFNSRFEEWNNDKIIFNNNEIEKHNKDNKYIINNFHIKYPTFNLYPNQFPTFYKGNMFEKDKDNNIKIKVNITDTSYQYIDIKIKDISSKSFLNSLQNYECNNPKLIQKGKKFFLFFPYEKKVIYKDKKETFIKQYRTLINNEDIKEINNENINNKDNKENKNLKTGNKSNKWNINENLRIMGIDLGINNDAVLSIIYGNGTVLAKKFINFSREKGCLKETIQKKNRSYSETGTKLGHKFTKINKKIRNIQKDLQNKIVNEIMIKVKEFDVDYVIMENLDNFIKTNKKSFKERFHYWNKIGIQNKLIYKLLDSGIRYRKINPAGTSQYAFDGSGQVLRGKDINDSRLSKTNTFNKGIYNHILCNSLNHNGKNKIYNADLNASYNIASRFIYNELLLINKSINMKSKDFKQFKTNVLNLFCRYSFSLADVKTANQLISDFSFAS
jgi:IS605 OrfB family transposase